MLHRHTVLLRLSACAFAASCCVRAAAAPSTLVQTDDAFRTHAGASGSVVRLGGGTAGGTTGINFEESESWVRSGFGYAYARANLATASLHALAESVPASVQGTGASAVLRDRLMFDVAGADRLTVTTIEVFWDQAGSISDELNLTWRSNLNLLSAGGGGTFQRRIVFDATPGPSLFDVDDWTLSFPDLNNPMANLPWSYASDSAGNFTARGFVHLFGERPEISLEAGLALLCQRGSDCDFDGSAYLRFGLPGNVTMTSESGLFLSAPVAAVPEPGALALMLTGLLGVAGATRRADGRRAPSLAGEISARRTSRVRRLRRLAAASTAVLLAGCGGGGGDGGSGSGSDGGGGGGGGNGAANGAASDCFNPVLAQVGTTYLWDARIVGAATGTTAFDARVTRITSFEGTAGLAETEATVTQSVQSGGNTFTSTSTLLDYAQVSGTTLTQYGQVTTVTAPQASTTRSVWQPPRADTRAALALGASVDVAWTTTDTSPPGTAPAQTTARNNRITYRGQESVTVPAGTFNACRFEILETPGNSERIEWVQVGTGAPLKTTAAPGTGNEASFELLGTSRLNGNPL